MKYCCIKGCTNAVGKKQSSTLKFYNFPTESVHRTWKREQRLKWINAVKKYVKNPDSWTINQGTVICSAHFVGNEKSEHPSHPGYVPCIFPGKKTIENQLQSVDRFKRLHHKKFIATVEPMDHVKAVIEDDIDNITVHNLSAVTNRSIGCQTDVDFNDTGDMNYFLCNLNNIDGIRHAEVQVNIMSKKKLDKICEADIITRRNMKDASCNPHTFDSAPLLCPGFHGLDSMKNDEDYSSITGVTIDRFLFILNILPDTKCKKISKKTRLLITLMKLKLGLRNSALSVIFQIHRTTVQKIFATAISALRIRLAESIIWVSKKSIKASMPEVFKRHYPDTRVIIDCTEIYCETPPQVREKVLMYSEYKHGYTVKFLVGCTPCGYISFVSTCYGGRASDCFITNDCGIISLLEPGDTVLADKGFPSIRTSVEQQNAIIVMPPFLHNPQFTPEEVEETYSVASVRIHIERVIQRIKNFHILDKLPNTLFKSVSDIVFVICGIVNMTHPIIAEKVDNMIT